MFYTGPASPQRRALRYSDMTTDAIKVKLDVMDEKLDTIVYWIDGNGKDGAKVRLDRLERGAAWKTRASWLLIGIIAAGLVERFLT